MKRSFSLFLALLLLLTGCTGPAAPEPAAPAPVSKEEAPVVMAEEAPGLQETHLVCETLPLPGDLGNVTAQCIWNGQLISGGQGPDGPLLLASQPDGSEAKALELPPETDFLYALVPENGGFTLLCGSFPANYLDGRNMQHRLEAPENRLFLCHYDSSGNLQGGVTLKKTYDSGSCIFKQVLPTPEGYVLLSRYHLIALDSAGQELAAAELEIGGPLSFVSMVLQENGLQVLCREPFSEDSVQLQTRSPASLEVLEEQTLKQPLTGLGQQPDGTLLLIGSGPQSGLLGEDGAAICLWQVLGAPLIGRQVFPLKDGYLFYDDYETALTLLREAPGSRPEPVVLTMAATGMGTFTELVQSFNLSQSDYRIDLTDYGLDFGSPDQAMTPDLLRTRILAGEAPDLYGFSSASSTVPPERAGLLPETICMDLAPLLEQENIRLLPKVRQLVTEHGCLYTLPLRFSLSSCQAPADLISQRGVTLEELEALRATAGDDYLPTPGWMTASNLFGLGLSFYVGKCIDRETGVCDFDTAEFRSFLTFCKDWTGDGQNPDRDQKYLLSFAFVCDLNFFLTYPEEQGPDRRYTLVGFPVTDGVGHQLHISSELGISSQCSSLDGALAFLHFCLEEGSAGRSAMDLPAMEDQLLAEIDALRQPHTDPLGSTMVFDEDRLALLWALLDETTVLADQDPVLQALLCQEAEAYFQGQKTLDEVVSLMQNRASLYLAEQEAGG